MAGLELIEIMLAEVAAVTVKRTTDDDVRTMANRFHREFKGTPDDRFGDAFDAWFSGQGDEPIRALPTTGMIWAHMRRADEASAGRGAVGFEYVKPRREFVEAARVVWDRAGLSLSVGRSAESAVDDLVKHVHVDRHPETNRWGKWVPLSGGEQEWEPCPKCVKSYDRRAEIAEILEDLPEPQEGRPVPCSKCDGSGWKETKASAAAVMSVDYADRVAYPCSVCNEVAFAAWIGEDREAVADAG